MRLLLDTHIFLWWLEDSRRLSTAVRKLILHAETVCVSSISIWEVAIKVQIGRLDASVPELVSAITTEGFCELPFLVNHAARVLELPHYHRDPFDRALIAQAICEPLRFVTVDSALAPYSALVEMHA